GADHSGEIHVPALLGPASRGQRRREHHQLRPHRRQEEIADAPKENNTVGSLKRPRSARLGMFSFDGPEPRGYPRPYAETPLSDGSTLPCAREPIALPSR